MINGEKYVNGSWTTAEIPTRKYVNGVWVDISPKQYGRTINLFDDTNVITIPNLGDRYGVELPYGYYSIYNDTDNTVFFGTANWGARQVACNAHSTATVLLNLNVGDVGGFFMPLNSASQGGVTIVSGSTPPDHYIPYLDWQ